MRVDELGILFFSISFVQNEFQYIDQIPDLLKLAEVVSHQFVGFGHFKAILNENILFQAQTLFELLHFGFQKVIDEFDEIVSSCGVKLDSVFGIIIRNGLLELKKCSIFDFTKLTDDYMKWIEEEEVNQIPLLLPPDLLFSERDPDEILTPYLSYDKPPPKPESIDQMPKNTALLLLYHALYHAKQRKTTLANDEMIQFCLKLSESGDPYFLSRSSTSLAQIFDIIGMKDSAKLILNESIGESKSNSNGSILSTAVALKANIDNSPSSWRYAASLKNPHPIASVKNAYLDNDFSLALKINPNIAVNVFGETNYQIASLAELTGRVLPILVLKYVEECQWKKAADVISSLNLGAIEVRATALAFAVAYFKADSQKHISNIYNDDLNDVLSINLGHFDELKNTIISIKDTINFSIERTDTTFAKLKETVLNANSTNEIIKSLNLCIKFHVFHLYKQLCKKIDKKNQQINIPEWPESHISTLEIEELLTHISKFIQ